MSKSLNGTYDGIVVGRGKTDAPPEFFSRACARRRSSWGGYFR